MPSKFEFDDTRSAIGADHMSEEERREMLNRFREGGGQVLSERELKKLDNAAIAERKKSGKGALARQTKLPSEIYREQRRAESERRAREKAEREKALKKFKSPLARFFIKMRCAMAGVAPFGSKSVKPKFMQLLALDVRQALVEFNLIGNELFLQDREIGKKIAAKLDQKNPIYMEVLERAHSLYKEEKVKSFLGLTEQHQNQFVALSAIAEGIRDFYAQLYYIYPYQEALKQAVKQALQIYKEESQDQTQIQLLEDKEKRFPKHVKNVFQMAFPRLFQLICLADDMDYPPFSPLLENRIGIVPDLRLGKRKKGEQTNISDETSGLPNEETERTEEETSEAETDETDQDKDEEENKPRKETPVMQTKEYQYGMSLMKRLDPSQLRAKYDTHGLTRDLPLNDKVVLAWLFFMEFDQEYSFVLTTNKIKLNVDYSAGVKTDYSRILADVYNESRDIIRAFEKYVEAKRELQKLKKNKMSSNYIEQSKLETKAEGRVDVEGRNTRALIRKFMEDVTRNLAALIADMKNEKAIVANMEDPIEFDKNLEGSKRLNGKKVKDCILESYCYSTALKERIEAGDLYGGMIEMSDDEMLESFGKTFQDSPQQ